MNFYKYLDIHLAAISSKTCLKYTTHILAHIYKCKFALSIEHNLDKTRTHSAESVFCSG